MHDIRAIRDDPAAFDAALARRGLQSEAAALLNLDTKRRAAVSELQELQQRRNEASRQVGTLKREGKDATALLEEVSALKNEMGRLEEEARRFEEALNQHLASIPNTPGEDVPDGEDDSDNVELRRWGEPAELGEPAQHADIGAALGGMDFETAARISGSRFVVLKGQVARLARALGEFMIDMHTTEHGYTEVAPPLLVRDPAMFGTGQLPKMAEDAFRTNSDHWLIPTSEVPLTNMVAESIVDAETLPLRMTAKTPCFRLEAGAAGKDTAGMIRQHQFDKVELVSITTPDRSAEEHERMVGCAEAVLQRLELPYRVVVLSTGDLGFCMHKTYDLEVWLPGQDAYREISSCSNAGAFQARRMNARFRAAGDKATRFLHTLNGSGVAIGRALIAVLENGQQPDGSVHLPAALVPYMAGRDRLEPQDN